MAEKRITFCPRCKKPLDARDFFSSGGVSDWRVEGPGVNVKCPGCGYDGPPAEAYASEYKKMMGK